jgi:hypothetical protein
VLDWWARWPQANVGILTGMVSGLAVLDIDPRNGGFETLVEFDAAGYTMPDSDPVVETGSRGLHHYVGLDRPLKKAAPFAGIEVQADGGLVVAPPSRHKSGRRYTWLRPPSSALPRLPGWVRRVIEHTAPEPSPPRAAPPSDPGRDDVLGRLHTMGFYVARHRRRGLHRIRCPWSAAHSNGDPEAVVVEPTTAHGWGFHCLHAHCTDRRVGDLLDVLAIPRRRV